MRVTVNREQLAAALRLCTDNGGVAPVLGIAQLATGDRKVTVRGWAPHSSLAIPIVAGVWKAGRMNVRVSTLLPLVDKDGGDWISLDTSKDGATCSIFAQHERLGAVATSGVFESTGERIPTPFPAPPGFRRTLQRLAYEMHGDAYIYLDANTILVRREHDVLVYHLGAPLDWLPGPIAIKPCFVATMMKMGGSLRFGIEHNAIACSNADGWYARSTFSCVQMPSLEAKMPIAPATAVVMRSDLRAAVNACRRALKRTEVEHRMHVQIGSGALSVSVKDVCHREVQGETDGSGELWISPKLLYAAIRGNARTVSLTVDSSDPLRPLIIRDSAGERFLAPIRPET